MRKYKMFAMAAIIAAVALGNSIASQAVTSSDINQKQQEKEKNQSKIDKAHETINELQELANDTKAYIRQIDEQIAEYNALVANYQKEIDEKTKQIEDNEKLLTQAGIDRTNQYNAMKLRIKYLYERGEETYLEVVLQAKDFGDLLNRSEYMSKITQYDRQMLDKLIETENLIAKTKAQLESDKASLVTLKEEAEESRAAAEIFAADKRFQLSALEGQEQVLNAQIETLENSNNALDSEIAEMERQLAAQQQQGGGGSYTGGQFVWPTVSHRINTYFGYGAYGDFRPGAFHSGVDIGATRPGVWGDPIYAAAGGTVVTANYNWSGGNWIWVDHGGGMYTIYMHMQSFLVGVGDYVSPGQQIGFMGSTGDSSGAHLHISVRINGEYVDPMPYLGY